jgi:hypothetical protein
MESRFSALNCCCNVCASHSRLIAAGLINVNIAQQEGVTPLMMLAGHEEEHVMLIEMLIKKGADCNATDNTGKPGRELC